MVARVSRKEKLIIKGSEGTFHSEGHVLFLDCGSEYTHTTLYVTTHVSDASIT